MKMHKLIINAAITGTVHAKSENPNLPCNPDEIIADARRCRDAGASIIHVHARDKSGLPTYKKEIYHDIISGIRSECPDILICASLSGRIYKEFWQRSQVLELQLDCKPDFASLTLGSMNFPNQASINESEMIKSLAKAMNERKIVPEWEVFDLGMVDYAHYLIRKNILVSPHYCNIFLGSLGTLNATPFNLAAMARALPPRTVWSAAGIGRFQFYVNSMAITMGGHVRVGLEDSLYYDTEKKHLATNAGLIERVVRVASTIGREVASPDEAREIIGMPLRTSKSGIQIKAIPKSSAYKIRKQTTKI